MHTRAITTPRLVLLHLRHPPSHLRPPPSPLYTLLPQHLHNHRHLYKYAKAERTPSAAKQIYYTRDHTLDESIFPPQVHLVDNSGVLQPLESLSLLLQRIDRDTHHVRQVHVTGEGVPVVKLVTKEELIEQARAKMRAKEAAASNVKRDRVEQEMKQVELTWSIDTGDKEYRIRRIDAFLREGRRVEVLIGRKKGGRKTTREEQEGLVEEVREVVRAVEGGEEWKVGEGKVGGQMVLFFQASEMMKEKREREVERKVEGRKEKLERREREKIERREKEERGVARRKEREQEERREREKLAYV